MGISTEFFHADIAFPVFHRGLGGCDHFFRVNPAAVIFRHDCNAVALFHFHVCIRRSCLAVRIHLRKGKDGTAQFVFIKIVQFANGIAGGLSHFSPEPVPFILLFQDFPNPAVGFIPEPDVRSRQRL